jgi:hypothetical protein
MCSDSSDGPHYVGGDYICVMKADVARYSTIRAIGDVVFFVGRISVSIRFVLQGWMNPFPLSLLFLMIPFNAAHNLVSAFTPCCGSSFTSPKGTSFGISHSLDSPRIVSINSQFSSSLEGRHFFYRCWGLASDMAWASSYFPILQSY